MDYLEKEKTFLDFFKKSGNKIYRLCFAYLKDKKEIDDLFQEVMINVWSNLHQFRKESKLETWIYRIAVNTALSYNTKLKRLHIDREVKIENFTDRLTDQENVKEQEGKFRKLYQGIASLNKLDRLIITLLLEDLSYQDIAEIAGLSSNHVGVKINRIKIALAKKIKEVSYE